MSSLDSLGAASYVLVTTFRKDGSAVPTPVWVVPLPDGALGIWTVTGSGKVKRVRRDPRVLVGPCDFRGRPLGPEVSGTATVVDAAPLRPLLARKYGVMGWLTVWGSRLRRGANGTIGIRITLDP